MGFGTKIIYTANVAEDFISLQAGVWITMRPVE
jgi:hypothetical protein